MEISNSVYFQSLQWNSFAQNVRCSVFCWKKGYKYSSEFRSSLNTWKYVFSVQLKTVLTWCTKTSWPPSSGVTNPNPLATLNHLHLPLRNSAKQSLLYDMIICSKSSFFVQKLNFDFTRKIIKFIIENSWKCCGFGLLSCWQLWFHSIKFGCKTRENVGGLSKLNFWTKIWL